MNSPNPKKKKVILVVSVILFSIFILDLSSERASGVEVQYYAETTDGYLECTSLVSYADCRAGTTLSATTNLNITVGQDYIPPAIPPERWFIQRGAVEYDTNPIPSNANIVSSTIYFRWAVDSSTTDFMLRLYTTDFGADLTTADWVTLAEGTLIGSLAHSSDFVADDWINLEVTKDSINKNGMSQFSILSWEDTNNSAPTDTETVDLWSADMTGTDYDSYLIVEYSVPDEPSKYGDRGKFDFKVRQVSERELVVWITETRKIPKDRLDFTWEVETGSVYQGEIVEVTLDEDLTWGESIFINMTATTKNTTHEIGSVNKQYTSNFVPLWLILTLLGILVFILIIVFLRRSKKGKQFVKNAKKRPKRWVRKAKLITKNVGIFGVLLIALVVVFTPIPTDPADPITIALFISILGLPLYLLLSGIIILLCVFYFGKRLIRWLKGKPVWT